MNQESTPHRTAPEPTGAKHGYANLKYVHTQPARRIQPLLMTHWKYLWREELIELRREGQVKAAEWLNDLTPDGTVI